jgi:hypothetical protein
MVGIECSISLPRIFNRPELWQGYEAVNKSVGSPQAPGIA